MGRGIIGSVGRAKPVVRRAVRPSAPAPAVRLADPALEERRLAIAAKDARLRVAGALSMQDLLDWQHHHPYGLGATAGTGLRSRLTFDDGTIEADTGDDQSPYDV